MACCDGAVCPDRCAALIVPTDDDREYMDDAIEKLSTNQNLHTRYMVLKGNASLHLHSCESGAGVSELISTEAEYIDGLIALKVGWFDTIEASGHQLPEVVKELKVALWEMISLHEEWLEAVCSEDAGKPANRLLLVRGTSDKSVVEVFKRSRSLETRDRSNSTGAKWFDRSEVAERRHIALHNLATQIWRRWH